jgi:hypothetical protein
MQANTPYNPAIHGGSTYLNGTNSFLSIASFPAIGTQDFTVECWVYAISTAITGGSNPRVFDLQGIQLVIEDTGRICRLDWNNGNALYTTSSGVFQINQWNHIAVVRISNTVSFYLNGVAQTGGTRSENLVGGTGYISAYRGATEGFLNGYICGFRATIGSGIYTAAFTPTMRPFGTLTNNQQPFSEDFTQSVYVKDRSSVVTGAAIAPDGTPTASKLVEDTTASNTHRWYFNQYTFTNAVSYTHSIYLKAGERTGAALGIWNGTTEIYCLVDLTNGSIAAGSSGTATVTSVGNGWYRCSVTHVGTGASGCGGTLYISNTSPPSGGNAYTGNGVSGLYMWGDQIEIASSMGNYVPTPANFRTAPSLLLNFANAAVVDTAGAQNFVTTTNATISAASKYGQGALYFDGTASTFLSTPYSERFLIGSSNYTVEFWCNLSAYGEIIGAFNLSSPFPGWLVNVGNFSTAGKIAFFHANGSTNQTLTGNATVPLNTWTHVAVVKQANFLKFFINGQLDSSHSLTITSTGSGQQINIGSDSNSLTAPGRRITGLLDDLRVTRGVARYWDSFTPPARALPETGGKSFVVQNINAGVVQRFTTTGTTSWTAPSDVTQVEVLVVAGGGGTGYSEYHNGGGGAGGLIYNNQYPVTPGQTYTVTVGAGGTGGTSNSSGNNTAGGNSIFGSLTALGGGKGGTHSTTPGGNGGSGGGGAENGGAASQVAGTGTAGQGFSGARGYTGGQGAGGGGGAGAPGGEGVNNSRGGNGGTGLQFGISGVPTYYAGGGGGANYYGNTTSSGGLGGGGIGWYNNVSGGSNGAAGSSNGTPNTGGGAGGYERADLRAGAVGGSGIVLIRYSTAAVGNTSDATTDTLTDSPTLYGHDMGLGGEVIGNYCTMNPVNGASATVVPSNGNLTVTWGNSQSNATIGSTMPVNSGRWYFEATLTTVGGNFPFVGIIPAQNVVGSTTSEAGYTNTIWVGNGQLAAGDVVGFAFDLDTLVASAYKNGVALSTGSAWNTSAIASGQGYWMPAVSGLTGTVWNLNFGQRAWAYTPPVGYNALTTKNLPRLTGAAAAPNQYFDTVLYTGTAATQNITLPGAFQPDLVWFKNRNVSQNHHLMDVNRGGGTILYANLNNTEDALGTSWANFTSTGFSLGASAGVNTSTHTYVAWCWRAGGAAVSNTSGTIASQVSANITSGFSVVTYTGTGVAGTVGHGQTTTAPRFILIKQRNVSVRSWPVYHAGLADPQSALYLDSVAGAFAYTAFFNNIAPTNLNFSLGTDATVNQSGSNYVAYVWSPVPGFSAFGSYTGNGAADGPFVYTGFKPRWVMWRRADATGSAWFIYDTARSTFNPMGIEIYANDPGIEASTTRMDFLSNGFKLRAANGGDNASTVPYIYMAFADKPFGNANGTAR